MISGPTEIPSGYAHHDEVYHAPGVSPLQDSGYPLTHERVVASSEAWRESVKALVDDMSANFPDSGPSSSRMVYIETQAAPGDVEQTYESFLREALINAGFVLSSDLQTPLSIRFAALSDLEQAALDQRESGSKQLIRFRKTPPPPIQIWSGRSPTPVIHTVDLSLKLYDGETCLSAYQITRLIPDAPLASYSAWKIPLFSADVKGQDLPKPPL